ncbi:MAG: hypothetical protein GEU74_01450 [Nitriliruptorales bacterium]|nr:hypothetical protein [Nitriliruptorales bacterium]
MLRGMRPPMWPRRRKNIRPARHGRGLSDRSRTPPAGRVTAGVRRCRVESPRIAAAATFPPPRRSPVVYAATPATSPRMRRALAAIGAVALLAGMLLAVPARAAEPRIIDDIVVRSDDGVPIVATLMLPPGASRKHRVPAILQTHGWGGTRQRTPDGTAGLLLQRGYAILTWDSRGFGESGGEANVAAPQFEVRDAKALIDYLAARREIRRDGPGDPRVGWIGGSNAAGIQFNTAALDRRVDAIAPEISWGDLPQDLVPNQVPKLGWNELLYGAGAAGAAADGVQSPAGTQLGVYAKQIHEGHAQIVTTGEQSSGITRWFSRRSTTQRSQRIRTPTLIIQGSIDTLFPLEDAFDNYRRIAANGTPVKLMAYCSGHSLAGCQYPGGATGYPKGLPSGELPLYQLRIINWMDRYVKGRRGVDTGPEVEWQAQNGRYYGARRFPLPGTEMVRGNAMTTGALIGPGRTGGDGPANGAPASADELGVTAARSVILPGAKNVRTIFGVPRVRLTGSARGLASHVFFELVDVAPDGTRVTLDDQTMPIRLGHGDVRRTFDLHGVAWKLKRRHALELEITTGSAQYGVPRQGAYTVDLRAVTVLPIS